MNQEIERVQSYDTGAADALVGREPRWYRVGSSYLGVASGRIGSTALGQAYIEGYSHMRERLANAAVRAGLLRGDGETMIVPCPEC